MSRSLLRFPITFSLCLLLAGPLLAGAAHAQASPSHASQKNRTAPGGTPGTGPDVTVDMSQLGVDPGTLDFGAVASGQEQTLALTLRNRGFLPVQLGRIRFMLGASGNSAAFRVTLDGHTYVGGTTDVARVLLAPVPLPRHGQVPVTVTFDPTQEQLDSFVLRFEAANASVDLPVSGLGGHVGDPYLHVVIDGPRWVVDYDGDGSEGVVLDGTGSHTHEPGHALAAYEWTIGGQVVSTLPTLSATLSTPETEVTLRITDDNVPPRSLAAEADERVVPPDHVPGVLAYYYDASASGAEALLDAVPASPDFVEQRPSFALVGTGQVGGSPFSTNVLVRMEARTNFAQTDTYTLTATGGADRRVFLDGALVTGPVLLAAGVHELEARFAVDALADLPLDLALYLGGAGGPLPAEALEHDETGVVPVIHALTASGAITGGDPIVIDGFGFFPPQQVVVHWGDMDLVAADFTALSPKRIEFLSPPGGGAIGVSVENANGVSNSRTFLYELNGPPPIQFRRDLIVTVPVPTAGVFGPDGKLYVASLDGRITVLEFDENYELVSQTIHAGVSGLTNRDTLSLAINPYDPPDPVKLYVGHGQHYLHGGASPPGPSPYTGQISVLTGPNFANPVPLVTGLPTSNHDHAINGIAFDDNGDLFVSVGSMTNAGIKALNSGDLPESPLSAAVVKVRLSEPAFNGAVTYVETATGLANNDQRFGESVDVAPDVDVELHASGLRNAYGLVYTTQGRLYATDNGPNVGFGPASTGPTTQINDPYDDDELNLVEWGNYYGSPNRGRGRADARQYVYYAGLHGPGSLPNTLFQMISWLPSSSDGIDEYRSDTFQGQLRGDLIVQKYQNKLRRLHLRADGRGVQTMTLIDPNTLGLGCVTGPGGAIVSFDYGSNQVEILEADDLTPVDFIVYDIFPWRAPASGGMPFTLAGRGFGTLATTLVTIGGHAATLTDVSWGRIHGIVPEELSPTTSMLDVVVTVGSNTDTLPAAFRYLLGAGNEPGRWEALADVGSNVGEVAAGVIDGTMYLVGEGSAATYAYDLQNRQWLSNKATRPFLGHHHAAEVVNDKLYLIGGINGGSPGTVQIYDPSTNSWTTGASLSWSGGSVSTATIGGKIYAAGGIVTAGNTVSNCAMYDPDTDTWTAKAAMPDSGRNHAAAGTDGSKLYVFGGRRGGNFPTNGYDSVMIYDPVANTWSWNGDVGSTLAPLPEARGGMGKAIWLRGEFYIFGGETLDDPDANANGVYGRVDVYNPATNTWRSENPMPNPRHGIFPVLYQGHIFLAGGGTQSGNSQARVFDTFTRQ